MNGAMAMMSDMALRVSAMQVLVEKFGLVDAERFIALINKEAFDYTEWRKDLFEGMSVREISHAAKQYCDENNDGM